MLTQKWRSEKLVCVCGAISREDGKVSFLYEAHRKAMNQEHIKLMLQKIRSIFPQEMKLMVYLDNARIHDCIGVRGMVQFQLPNMFLQFGVKYTPVYNGIEFSWNIIKRN